MIYLLALYLLSIPLAFYVLLRAHWAWGSSYLCLGQLMLFLVWSLLPVLNTILAIKGASNEVARLALWSKIVWTRRW